MEVRSLPEKYPESAIQNSRLRNESDINLPSDTFVESDQDLQSVGSVEVKFLHPSKRHRLDMSGSSRSEAQEAGLVAQQSARKRCRGFLSSNRQRSGSSTSKKSQSKNIDRFNKLMNKLEYEALITAAKLSDDLVAAHSLLKNTQDFCRKVQIGLGKKYRIHVVLESAIPGRDIHRKYRGIIPVFSNTLLPALESGVLSSSIVAGSMSEALEVAERVALLGHAIAIEDFDLTATPTSPSLRLSTRMPGRRLKAINASDRSKLVNSAISSFLDTESTAEAAANELRQI